MQVGLGHSQGWTLDLSIPASAHLIHIMVEPTLMHHMRDAAAAHHIRVAAWLRHAVRQVTRDDFPASWLAGDIPARSHESGYYYRKFQVRLDADTSQKLEELTRAFHPPTADEIRLLVAQANLQDFPESWRMAADEHRTRQSP